MASEYNLRLLPAEVMIDGNEVLLQIRRRRSHGELTEQLLEDAKEALSRKPGS